MTLPLEFLALRALAHTGHNLEELSIRFHGMMYSFDVVQMPRLVDIILQFPDPVPILNQMLFEPYGVHVLKRLWEYAADEVWCLRVETTTSSRRIQCILEKLDIHLDLERYTVQSINLDLKMVYMFKEFSLHFIDVPTIHNFLSQSLAERNYEALAAALVWFGQVFDTWFYANATNGTTEIIEINEMLSSILVHAPGLIGAKATEDEYVSIIDFVINHYMDAIVDHIHHFTFLYIFFVSFDQSFYVPLLKTFIAMQSTNELQDIVKNLTRYGLLDVIKKLDIME